MSEIPRNLRTLLSGADQTGLDLQISETVLNSIVSELLYILKEC